MKVSFYFEALGSPKEFVTDFLDKLLKEIKKFEKAKLLDSKVEEPLEREVPTPNGKTTKMWSSFLETTMEFDNFDDLLDFILMYNPSSIELLDSIKLEFDKEKLNNVLNTITARLIQLTLVINNLKAQNALMLKHLEKLSPRVAQQFKTPPQNYKFKLKS